MKKLTLTGIAVLALLVVSCKKDYTCTCTETSTTNGGSTVTTNENPITIKEVSKGTAKSICKDYESTYTYSNTSGSSSAQTGGGTYKTTCTLDKK